MAIGIRFTERMAGWISIDSAAKKPFEINLHVFSPWILRWTRPRAIRGYALFLGTHPTLLSPDPWLGPKVSGTLTTTLRGVAYDFEFKLSEIGKVKAVGEKRYRWTLLHPRSFFDSLVQLPLELYQDGKNIGNAHLTYPDPIWRFALGIRFVSERFAFDRTLSLAERLLALTPVFVPNHRRYLPQADDRGAIERLSLQLGGASKLVELAICMGVLAIKLVSWLRFGRNVHKLSSQQCQKYSNLLSRNKLLNLLTTPVTAFLLSALFSDPGYLEAQGQNIPARLEQSEPEPWMNLCVTPSSTHSKDTLEVDVVIVGSGAGGGPAAYELASRGYAVAVIEEGHFYGRRDMSGNRLEMIRRLYRNAGISFPISNSPLWLPTGKCVGGTTAINCGTSLRCPEHTRKRWEEELGLTGLELDPYYEEVERMLDVKPVPQAYQGGIAGVMGLGLDKLPTSESRSQLKPLLRGETGCDGQSLCIFGCPTGAKRSTNVSYIPAAMKRNAFLFTHYQARKILMENGRAVGIQAGVEGYGDHFNLNVRSRKIILAGGTLNTPYLIKCSGLDRGLSQLGRNLTLHPAINVGAFFDHAIRERYFVPQSMGVFRGEESEFVLEGHTLLIDAIPLSLQVFGELLGEIMSRPSQFTNFAAMLVDQTSGRLAFLPGHTPMPVYFFNAKMVNALKNAVAILSEIFIAAGARSVFPSIQGIDRIQSRSDVMDLRKANLRASDFKNLSAHHPLGTCRMGSDPSHSVINRDGQVWGVENLYVTDGSALPGPLGVNPQLTIMANSLRIARAIGNSL